MDLSATPLEELFTCALVFTTALEIVSPITAYGLFAAPSSLPSRLASSSNVRVVIMNLPSKSGIAIALIGIVAV
jgi:hypothetical protein